MIAPAAEIDAQTLVRQHALDPVSDGDRVVRIDEHGRIRGHFGKRRHVRRHHRRAAGHGFERRQAESLVERREREDRGRGDQLVIINVAVPTKLTKEQRELMEKLAESLGTTVKPQEKGFLDWLNEALGGG